MPTNLAWGTRSLTALISVAARASPEASPATIPIVTLEDREALVTTGYARMMPRPGTARNSTSAESDGDSLAAASRAWRASSSALPSR